MLSAVRRAWVQVRRRVLVLVRVLDSAALALPGVGVSGLRMLSAVRVLPLPLLLPLLLLPLPDSATLVVLFES